MFSRKWLTCIAGVAGLIATQSASAYVECSPLRVATIMTADGSTYIYWTNGGMGSLSNTGYDRQAILGLATTALTLELTVTVRLADGSSCTGSTQSIVGFALNRS